MKKSKRYVVFFTDLTKVIGSKRSKQLTVRTASGPVDAYRKATGWKGRVTSGKGYTDQTPARQVHGFHARGGAQGWTAGLTEEELNTWIELDKTDPPPPVAYIVPLGKW